MKTHRTFSFGIRAFMLAIMVAAVPALSRTAMADSALQKGDMVAICGDSITEQKLYSLYMADYFLMCQPAPGLHEMQTGLSGEMSPSFLGRMKINVFPFKPTVATVCYGMNDGQYAPTNLQRLENYKKNMGEIAATFKQNAVRVVVLGSAPAVDPVTFKTADVYNPALADMAHGLKEVAAAQGVLYADVYGATADAMAKAKAKYGQKYHLGGSGQHPGPNGHLVMAYAFLKALGCDGDIGTVTLDMKSDKAEATDGHKILSVAKGDVEIESTRYPFCFYGVPASPSSTRGIIDFIPFNQDLNRYMLVVKNAPTKSLKVTWGKQGKTYPAAELEKGINLAAEFLDNPFSEPFAAVEKKIIEQQNFETPGLRKLQHSLADWRESVPEEQQSVDRLERGLYHKWQTLSDASSAAVVPVRHVIQVEPVGK